MAQVPPVVMDGQARRIAPLPGSKQLQLAINLTLRHQTALE
ncbi:MAG: hypothetical protein U1F23_00030 [Lysobacterales bacterium]